MDTARGRFLITTGSARFLSRELTPADLSNVTIVWSLDLNTYEWTEIHLQRASWSLPEASIPTPVYSAWGVVDLLAPTTSRWSMTKGDGTSRLRSF